VFLSVKGYKGLNELRNKENILFAKDDAFLSRKLSQKGRTKFCKRIKVTLLYRIRVNKNKDCKEKLSIYDIFRKAFLGTLYDYKIKRYFEKRQTF
jgi:hypothetical protein